MQIKQIFTTFILVFVLGWMASSLYSHIAQDLNGQSFAQAFSGDVDSPGNNKVFRSNEVASPKDRISEDAIHVYDDKVIIDIDNPEWSTFTDTNSMDPFLDIGANAIHIVPQSPDELEVGDIIAYQSGITGSSIIHRIVEKGSDADGAYFILKGDNNPYNDPEKVRFSQVKRVLVAIIY